MSQSCDIPAKRYRYLLQGVEPAPKRKVWPSTEQKWIGDLRGLHCKQLNAFLQNFAWLQRLFPAIQQ